MKTTLVDLPPRDQGNDACEIAATSPHQMPEDYPVSPIESPSLTLSFKLVASRVEAASASIQLGRLTEQDFVRRFEELTSQWQAETAFLSSPLAIADHPAYQEIIGMGEEAISLVLHALRDSPNHWFVALERLTGTNAVQPDHAGIIEVMAADWVAWGEDNGYLD
jgi:hypothetical protein